MGIPPVQDRRSTTSPFRSTRVAAIGVTVGVVGLVGALLGVAGATSAANPANCSVEYQVLNQWPGGFQGAIEITNTGSDVDGWTLRFDMPDGQGVNHGWAGAFSQSGPTVQVVSRSWNASLDSGRSVTAGFIGRYSGANGVPAAFTLNGTDCNGGATTPSTVSPTTVAPTTTFPTTTFPTQTTAVPTTVAPTTAAPTTAPATTAPPSTVTSTTVAPTTVAPTTAPPTTITTTTVAPTTVAPTTVTPTTAPPATTPNPSGAFYVDPESSAARWVAQNPNDPRASAIRNRIASKSIGRWFGDWNGNVEGDVRSYVNRARQSGGVPVLVAYNIPDRDCGQHSSGGAANFSQYRTWITDFADGLGNGPAFIVLEPDALALNSCAGSDRNDAIANAVTTIKRECGSCKVYIDAGHSSWVSAADMADRLEDAGVFGADGFATNTSNYRATGSEQAYGQSVLRELGNRRGLGQVIDVSRNGNGPAAGGEWCDPAGRAIGADPTTNTGIAHVDALLWIKVPGEADGCLAGAGQFVPDRAYRLATN